jgi:hypothetical protein
VAGERGSHRTTGRRFSHARSMTGFPPLAGERSERPRTQLRVLQVIQPEGAMQGNTVGQQTPVLRTGDSVR